MSERNLFFLLLLFFINGCSSKSVNKNIDTVDKVIDTSIQSVNTEISNDSLNYLSNQNEYIKENYVTNILVIDTSVYYDNTMIQVKLMKNCRFDSLIKIPSKYNWGDDKIFVTHNVEYQVLILKNNKIEIDDTLNKGSFDIKLDKQIIDYGVLQYPNLIFIDKKDRKVGFSFSISIPMTDLGVEVEKYYKM